ncbi:MAG: glucose PTS transporter subunit IIA [Phascolarctobacterium sp.]
MKDKIFRILQVIGRSFMLPIAVLPIAGMLLGIGASFTNKTTIQTYGLERFLGDDTLLHSLLTIMSETGNIIFANLPVVFAVGVAIGMVKLEKEVAALSALIAFLVMHASTNSVLKLAGDILPDGKLAPHVLGGTITNVCGIMSLQEGVFGGIIVGLGVAWLHNRFHNIELPSAFSFFGGSRFVPIISTVVYMFVGILMYFIWPSVQNGIFMLGNLVTGTGYSGTFLYGIIDRSLIPFGLHHAFYIPIYQTGLGGSMMVDGQLVQGAQNIFFAQLASPNVTKFSVEATRFFSGSYLFMVFGLPGAALAMYRAAKPAKKKAVGGLLLSAALTSMLTGITEPIEFSFLFVAPLLYYIQVFLASTAFVIAEILNITVCFTFSSGLIDLFIFGVLQGNAKTNWLMLMPLGVLYFFIYYFIFSFMIKRFNYKTPGREDDEEETKLYTKADVLAKKEAEKQAEQVAAAATTSTAEDDALSVRIAEGLGGANNIAVLECCITRLRLQLVDDSKVNEALLKATGAMGVVHAGEQLQVIYGPKVTGIKLNLEAYLEKLKNNPQLAKEHAVEATAPVEEASIPVADAGTASEAAAVDEEPKAAKSSQVKDAAPAEAYRFASPFTGELHPITEAPDEAFASKMTGDGFFVYPTDGTVYAPADSMVGFVFDTKHAMGLMTNDGVEYLLHIGVDTVKLEGKGFEVFVQDGQEVKKGDKLMSFDAAYIKEHATSDACLCIFTALEEGKEVKVTPGTVKALDAAIWF